VCLCESVCVCLCESVCTGLTYIINYIRIVSDGINCVSFYFLVCCTDPPAIPHPTLITSSPSRRSKPV